MGFHLCIAFLVDARSVAISHSGAHYQAHNLVTHLTPMKAHESLESFTLFSAAGNHETKSKLSLCGVPHPPDTTNRAGTPPAFPLSSSLWPRRCPPS